MEATATTLVTSLFHEPWWLEAAAQGAWDEVSITASGRTIARFPYAIKRIAGVVTLCMPPLTRTLGPQLPISGTSREHRQLTAELISRLPRHGAFRQVFDPRLSNALAFYEQGYHSALSYTMQIAANVKLAERWSGIRPQMRQALRKAERLFSIGSLDIGMFCEFHNHHLKCNHRVRWSELFVGRADRVKINLYEAALGRNAARLMGARDQDGVLRAAIMLVWGHGVMYYLLTAHDAAPAGSGAVKLLVWEAMKLALEQNLAFDFDGFFRPSAVNFQTGFGGEVCNRIIVSKTPILHVCTKAVVSRLRFGL